MTRFSGSRIFAITVAVGLALAGGIPTATAAGSSHDKVYVCKYVGTPNVNERLQGGGNPIDVSVNSIKPFEGIGSYFADAQGQSYVLAWADGETPEPPVSDCPAPRGPDPVVTTSAVSHTTCTAFTTTTTTTTTPYVFTDGTWVLGVPVITTGEPVISTPTAEQLREAGLDCRPEQPAAEVVVTPEHTTTCDKYSVRDVTVTTPYVWNAESAAWELGKAGEPVYGAWVDSTPTAEQLTEAGLDCTPEQPVQPAPIVTTSAVSDTTCTAFTTTTTTTTTPYVLAAGTWVLGVPVITTGAPVISTPTADQITAAGLDCTTPVPPVVDQPVVDQPVVQQPVVQQPVVQQPVVDQPVQVLGVTATATPLSAGTANPLPAGASAGEADTSGQALAGELTGLAALLVLSAGFMLRRRRGDV